MREGLLVVAAAAAALLLPTGVAAQEVVDYYALDAVWSAVGGRVGLVRGVRV